MPHTIHRCTLAAFVAAAFATSAQASCGQAFCTVNTDWHAQGVWSAPGWRADLRYEFVEQNQLRSGNDKVNVGQIERDHDELRTLNRNWVGTLSYWSGTNWGASLTVPVVSRFHSHVHSEDGELENWRFGKPGDVRAVGRYEFAGGSTGLEFGLKLPTGESDVRNGDGELAERTLQPGTGTTDAVIGAYWRGAVPTGKVFLHASAQLPLNEHDGYRPGQRIGLDLGYTQNVAPNLALLLQANVQFKRRDRGVNAEPEDSGSRALSLSSGLSYAFSNDLQAYVLGELPVYRHVNGVQLTNDWAIALGVSKAF